MQPVQCYGKRRAYLQTAGLIATAAIVAVALLTSSGTADANDQDTCFKESGDIAIAACTRAITAGNLSGHTLAVTYDNRGEEYKDKRDYDRAMADFNEAIRHDPKWEVPVIARGFVYFQKGDLDRALADFAQAIRLNPKNTLAYNNRGHVYLKKGDYDRAIEDLNVAIRLDRSHAQAYANRGLAYEGKGDKDRAKADFLAALAAPLSSNNGKWAHDTAREHLGILQAK